MKDESLRKRCIKLKNNCSFLWVFLLCLPAVITVVGCSSPVGAPREIAGLSAEALFTDLKLKLESESGDLWVPDQYVRIQEAIDAAASGDVIVVKPGLYRESLDFKGKELILRSTDPGDPATVAATVIEGNCGESAVTFGEGEGPGAVLAGFTISAGGGTFVDEYWGCYGGGILVIGGGTPLIAYNVIDGNGADCCSEIGDLKGAYFGGGIAVIESDPYILANRVVGNAALVEGGGIYVLKASPLIAGNTISGNTAKVGGGIAVATGSPAVIYENRIENNGAEEGGGLSILASTPWIYDNTISGNNAVVYGGAVSLRRAAPDLSGNRFESNTASVKGGALCLSRDSVISRSFFYRNHFTGNKPEKFYYQASEFE